MSNMLYQNAVLRIKTENHSRLALFVSSVSEHVRVVFADTVATQHDIAAGDPNFVCVFPINARQEPVERILLDALDRVYIPFKSYVP